MNQLYQDQLAGGRGRLVRRVVKSASGAWFRGPIVELAPCTAIQRSASDDEAGRTRRADDR